MGNQQAVKPKSPQQRGVDRDEDRGRALVHRHHPWTEQASAIGNQAAARFLRGRSNRFGLAEATPSRQNASQQKCKFVDSLDAPLQSMRVPLSLQRKCACGGAAFGECEECTKKSLGVQAKLRSGEPQDVYEQEADRVADQVVRMPALSKPSDAGNMALRAKIPNRNATDRSNLAAAPAIVHEVLRSPGTPVGANRRDCERPGMMSQAARNQAVVRDRKISIFPPSQQTLPALPRLQAKLAVGAVNDPLEIQAERVAGQVMLTPDPGLAIAPAPLKLSRKCAACEEEEEKLQREPKSEDVAEIPRLPENELTKGGDRLPPKVAEFFETRFGRDFGAVRVHTGETATHYNDAVNAYAFTYGSHIWLGPGLHPQPSHILAHELAHVVQQTQPPSLALAPVQPDLSASHQFVQRSAPYWLPAKFVVKDKEARGKVGTGTHQLVLPVMGRFNKIFTEAPVPNADRNSADDGKVGIADLCESTNDSGEPITVGVYFLGRDPKELTTNLLVGLRQLNYKGGDYQHKLHAAPRADEKRRRVIHALGAPTKIFVGDLKPPHDTPDAASGAEQVRNYLKGFNWARNRVNEMSVGEGSDQTDAKWGGEIAPSRPHPLETGIINLRVPPEFSEPAASGQKSEPLVLNYEGKVYHPPDPRLQPVGKVYVRHSEGGIWNYRWKTDKPVTAAELETYEHTRGMNVRNLIIDPLLIPAVQTKARPARGPSKLTPSPRRIQAREREIAPEEAKDPFDEVKRDTWVSNHKRLSGEEEKSEKTPEFKKAEFESLVIQERQAAIDSGFHYPPISKAEKETAKGLKQIRFWTNPATIVFGELRYWFGGLFVKVANAYHTIRAKFHELLHGKNASESGSSLASTIIKIGFQVLKIIARVMIDRTAGYLIQSLKIGVGTKLRSLIPEEGIEEFEAKVAEIAAKTADLKQRAKETIGGWITGIIGPYEGYIKTIETVANTLTDIKDIVEKVKWGARVVACLSPPAWGCLWIALQSVLERFASWLIDRCWFKKDITPLVMKIDFVASLPKQLAGFIINGIKGILPGNLSEVLADPVELDKDEKAIPPDEICNVDDRSLRPPFEVEKAALAELRQEIGEDKWEAWTKLAKLYGRINYGAPLNEAQIAELKKELKKASVPALKEAAELHGFTPTKEVTNLTAFLEEAQRVKEEMYGGGGEGGGEGGISVLASEKAPAGKYKPTKLGFEVVSGVTTGVYQGATINVDRAANIKGTEVKLQGVEVVVRKRVLVPNVANPEKIVWDLEVTKDQYFNIEERYGAEVVKKIGYKIFQYKKGVKFSYTLQLKAGKAE